MKLHRKYSPILLGILSSSILMLIFSKNIFFEILSFGILSICSLYTVSFDLAHPVTWFLPVFFLYTVAPPILVYIGLLDFNDYSEVILLHYIAALTFIIFVGFKRYKYNLNRTPFTRNSLGAMFIFWAGVIIIILYICSLYLMGIHSKYDRAISHSPLAFLGFGAYILTTAMSIIVFNLRFKSNKSNLKFPIIGVSILFLLYVLFTGERHAFFRFLLVSLIIYHTLIKPLKLRHLMLFFIVALILSAFLQQLKMVFLSNQFTFSAKFMLIDILYSEFKSAGRNLAILINYVPNVYSYSYGKMLVMDIVRAFIPGFIFPHFESTAVWFNKTFFPSAYEKGLGLGFTLVGTGYVNFGPIGVIFLFAILALIIKFLYKLSTRSPIFYLIYVNYIPIVAFSIRGDFSSLLSSIWKHVILFIILALIIDKVLLEISRAKKEKGHVKSNIEQIS